jgi:hypothetical protein
MDLIAAPERVNLRHTRRSARLWKKTGWRGGLPPEPEDLPRDESVTPMKEAIFQREISTSLGIRACR